MILESKTYQEDVLLVARDKILSKLKNKTIMITGACGLIGSFLVDVLMQKNILEKSNITVIAYDFKKEFIENRFKDYLNHTNFKYIYQDVNLPLDYHEDVDYIMHLASNAHPSLFKTDPVGTIKSNIMGLYNLLEYARLHNISRVLYTSTGEVYGQAGSDIKEFYEDYSGYVNPDLARSCYPASKRCAETLCVSYTEQYNVDTVIARPSHVYGPTMTKNDSRVYAEFVRNVLNGQDIVLKSSGSQVRSYTYVADCVLGLLYVLLKGESKNAYNIANKDSITSIKNMACVIAKIGKRKVIMDIPKETNSNANPMECGVLDDKTLKKLHDVQLEILDEFVRICEENNLQYFLVAGTLLGAVRHAGFIPWDDDVDVGMPRKDYDKFIQIAKKELDSKYYLDCLETNKDFYLPFAKIKKNGTIFKESFSDNIEGNKGIFIDVFPFENVKKGRFGYKLRFALSLSIMDALFHKKRMRKLKNMTCAPLSVCLSVFPKNWLVKLFHFIVTMVHDEQSKYISVIGTGYGFRRELVPRSEVLPTKKIKFEKREYRCMANNDCYLSNLYGNYMELPPVEKRRNHMPSVLDFGDEDE